MHARIAKVDEALGVVFGWAIVSEIDGQPYFDLQGDHIPEGTMLKAAAEFMAGDRPARIMHGTADGRIVFAFPLTKEIASAMGVEVNQTGLMIGLKPDDPATLKRFASGEFSGFSIGGTATRRAA